MLLEHEAPFLDDVEQGLLEGSGVNAEPCVKDMDGANLVNLTVDLLIRVNLQTEK